jgi:hypothetical protein
MALFVVNDHRQLRSYRIDHIDGIKPATKSCSPSYPVEF